MKTASGQKCEGEAVIRNKQGQLLVQFKSKDAEGYWPSEWQRLRIEYSMRHRRDKIPMYLRTGQRPWWLRLLGHRFGVWRLQRLILKEAKANG